VSPEAALEDKEILDTPVAVDKLIVLSCASSVWKLETATFSIPSKVTEADVIAAVLVPAMLKTNESVPAPPLRLSPGLKVVPFAAVPFVPIAALNVSLPAPPVKLEPESALVVSVKLYGGVGRAASITDDNAATVLMSVKFVTPATTFLSVARSVELLLSVSV